MKFLHIKWNSGDSLLPNVHSLTRVNFKADVFDFCILWNVFIDFELYLIKHLDILVWFTYVCSNYNWLCFPDICLTYFHFFFFKQELKNLLNRHLKFKHFEIQLFVSVRLQCLILSSSTHFDFLLLIVFHQAWSLSTSLLFKIKVISDKSHLRKLSRKLGKAQTKQDRQFINFTRVCPPGRRFLKQRLCWVVII